MSVGRLDEKSEGLLLLTTNGKFSNYITSTAIEKEYHVMVDGIVTNNIITNLLTGVKAIIVFYNEKVVIKSKTSESETQEEASNN